MKLQKLSLTLKVFGQAYNKDFIGKNMKDLVLKHYIKTSELPYFNNINTEERPYDLSKGPDGFYVIDGAKFDDILKSYKDKDNVVRENIIDELKNKYPILYQQKKTQRLIIPPLKKRFIWDAGLYHELIKEMYESGTFCNTQLLNNVESYLQLNDYIPEDKFHQEVYVNYDNNQNAKDIYICSTYFKHINEVEKIIKTISNRKTIGTIKITNQKINFFVPLDFNKTEAPQRGDRSSTPMPEKFEERVVKCPNGEYEIQLFVDDIFIENGSKVKKYNEEVTKALNDLNKIDKDELEELDFQYEKFIEMQEKLKQKYPIKNTGTHVYCIKLNDQNRKN